MITHHKNNPDHYYLKRKKMIDEQNKKSPMDVTCMTCGIHFENVYDWWLHLEVEGYHKVLHGYTRRGDPCIIEHFVTD